MVWVGNLKNLFCFQKLGILVEFTWWNISAMSAKQPGRRENKRRLPLELAVALVWLITKTLWGLDLLVPPCTVRIHGVHCDYWQTLFWNSSPSVSVIPPALLPDNRYPSQSGLNSWVGENNALKILVIDILLIYSMVQRRRQRVLRLLRFQGLNTTISYV